MAWKDSLIERRVKGTPGNCRVLVDIQPDTVRFFICYGSKIRYTKRYPTLHDGMAKLAEDYRREAKAS